MKAAEHTVPFACITANQFIVSSERQPKDDDEIPYIINDRTTGSASSEAADPRLLPAAYSNRVQLQSLLHGSDSDALDTQGLVDEESLLLALQS